MKKSTYFLSAIAVAMFWICSIPGLQAQTNTDHQFTIQTRYMIPMSPAERTELGGLLKEYFDKVTSKNEFILHQWNMNHHYTDDSREFLTINEYANWDDIVKAADHNAELEKIAWPDEKKLGEFMKKMASFFTYHKDGIFNGMLDMTK